MRFGNEICRRCAYKRETVNGMYCVRLRENVEYATKPACKDEIVKNG